MSTFFTSIFFNGAAAKKRLIATAYGVFFTLCFSGLQIGAAQPALDQGKPNKGKNDGNAQNMAAPIKPLKISISRSEYLPDDMYGYWSVTGTLMESNSPDYFNRLVHNIWVLEQSGEKVVVSNPVNGASASIDVDKVEGQTATFHRTVILKGGKIFFEMPTVTVNVDRLDGTTINEIRYLRNGRVTRSYFAKYRLVARRIGGEKVRMPAFEGSPEIQIDDSRLR
ncbi:MAG: hypothetical protein VKJ04_00445 [Vampirovibrionales bacterium]|nr:hypothetical protein [Vampirovibrionales bacterium]